MESEWRNNRRDIGYYRAREELLGQGSIMFFEPNTTTPKYVFNEDIGFVLPNPVVADYSGDFGEIGLNGDYSIVVRNNAGDVLLSCTTSEGFDLYS